MEAVTTGTPSGTTETSSTPASATATPSSTVTPEQRPTFAQAFAADTKPADAAADPSAPTTPAPAADPNATAPKPGEPPQEKWPTILENARVKAKTDAQAEFRQAYGWAEPLQQAIAAQGKDPGAVMQQWTETAQIMSTDPVRHITEYLRAWEGNPEVAQALRSQAGRILAGGRTAPAVDLTPDVQIVDEQGRVSGSTFSAERVQAIVQHAVADAIGKEVAPLKQESAARQAERQQAEAQAKAEATSKANNAAADDVMAEADDILDGALTRQDPAILGEIAKVWKANDKWSFHRVALAVQKSHIKPGAAANAQRAVLAELKTKAGANGVNPAGAVTSATHRPTSFNDPSLKW